MTDLRDRLRDAHVPDEAGARERGWRVVEAAYAGRGRAPARRSRRAGLAIAAAAAVALLAVAVGLTPPGEAIGQWVRQIVRPTPSPPARVRSALGPLPGHGRLLVTAPTGAWIVQPDGTRRRLGAYEDATFSPRGLFEAVTRGRMLAAVDPLGRVRWTLTRPRRVSRPAWSPDGFRVAYRSGPQLRVVYGDGALDRLLARRSAPVTPAWRPGPGHRLAYAAQRTVVLRDADTGRILSRISAPGRVTQLAWSPTGRRLLVVTPAAIRILGSGGHPRRTIRAPARRVAWLPGGRAFAVVRADRTGAASVAAIVPVGRAGGASAGGGQSAASDAARALLVVPTRLTDVLVSPDGRWLLLSAPDAGQWLLVRTSGSGHLTALSRVGRQFDPGGRGRPALPGLDGWIP